MPSAVPVHNPLYRLESPYSHSNDTGSVAPNLLYTPSQADEVHQSSCDEKPPHYWNIVYYCPSSAQYDHISTGDGVYSTIADIIPTPETRSDTKSEGHSHK